MTFLLVAGLLVTPLAYLAFRSVWTPSGFSLQYYRLLATTGEGALVIPVWTAAAYSLRIALGLPFHSMTWSSARTTRSAFKERRHPVIE